MVNVVFLTWDACIIFRDEVAKVKHMLSLRGWQMGEFRMMSAPLPLTGGTGPSPVMLAVKFASMQAQLFHKRRDIQPTTDSGDDKD